MYGLKVSKYKICLYIRQDKMKTHQESNGYIKYNWIRGITSNFMN